MDMASHEEIPEILGVPLSPFAARAAIALNEKGVPFKFTVENLMDKSERLLKLNPVHKQIPIFVHNGRAVCESMIIVDYIEETWSHEDGFKSLYPVDPYQRSVTRFWVDFCQRKIANEIYPLEYCNKISKQDMEGAFVTLENAYVEHSKGKGPFFFGSELSVVDIAFAPLIPWLPSFEHFADIELPSEKKHPRLYSWMKALEQHPSVKAALYDAADVLDLVTRIREKTKDYQS